MLILPCSTHKLPRRTGRAAHYSPSLTSLRWWHVHTRWQRQTAAEQLIIHAAAAVAAAARDQRATHRPAAARADQRRRLPAQAALMEHGNWRGCREFGARPHGPYEGWCGCPRRRGIQLAHPGAACHQHSATAPRCMRRVRGTPDDPVRGLSR